MKPREYSLMVDIDGTLAEQKQGFDKYKPRPIDEPLPYAKEGMTRLIKHFKIIIFSTRKQAEGEAWLQKHEIPYDSYMEKPLNFLIIDDRCMKFNGDWRRTVSDVGRFQPWYKQDKDMRLQTIEDMMHDVHEIADGTIALIRDLKVEK